MFAVGQTNAQVVRKKVSMPREFNLRKKGRKIYGAWVGDRCLMSVDTGNRIRVPASLEHANVSIRGCISTIELQFTPQKQA